MKATHILLVLMVFTMFSACSHRVAQPTGGQRTSLATADEGNDLVASAQSDGTAPADTASVAVETPAEAPVALTFADSIRAEVETLIRLPYSQMSDSSLKALRQRIAPRRASDFSLQMDDAKLGRAIDIRNIIEKSCATLTVPYDATKVELARRRLCELESRILTGTAADPRPWTEAQWAEVKVHINACAGYSEARDAFASLIADIQSLRAPYSEATAGRCKATVAARFADFDNEWAERLAAIPYLDTRYRAYREAVSENAFHGIDIEREMTE